MWLRDTAEPRGPWGGYGVEGAGAWLWGRQGHRVAVEVEEGVAVSRGQMGTWHGYGVDRFAA